MRIPLGDIMEIDIEHTVATIHAMADLDDLITMDEHLEAARVAVLAAGRTMLALGDTRPRPEIEAAVDAVEAAAVRVDELRRAYSGAFRELRLAGGGK
ncbi:hypothetical protein [Nocardia sp. NPDC050435]|uniref:hypothetical protein n=1 Tax=Nocardia sp. NPDC050435 TaxID=3155040 RepID=UPI0033FE4520